MLDVVEILVSTRSSLVPHQIGQTDHGERQTPPVDQIEGLVHPPGPGLCERDAIDRTHEVDAMRRSAELNYHAGLPQLIFGRHARNTATPEFTQCREKPRGVVGRLLVPEVHVAREARVSMVDDRLTADEQEPDAVLRERRDELLDVGRKVIAPHDWSSDSRTSGACSP